MNAEVEKLRAEVQELRAQFRRERRRFRVQMWLALCAVIGAMLISPASRSALAQGYGVTLAQLAVRMAAVENKAQFISVSGGEMFITGTNLHIINGLGSSDATNGL